MGVSVKSITRKLESAYEVSDWWPSESRFEIAVGAILTQRTSWKNVQIALANLKSLGLMSPEAICSSDASILESAVRPSGFYRQKSEYLGVFSSYLVRRYGGDIEKMRGMPVDELRTELLELRGIGQETADTIILYALGLPSFVVDSYSFRLLSRLGLYSGRDYQHVKGMFERAVGMDARALSRAHAAVVVHCKEHCKAKPVCDGCPVRMSCHSRASDDD